jgi:hypothetical protein
MAIEIEVEDTEELKKWGLGLHKIKESCHFCKTPTDTWHMASNTPVCSVCAGKYGENDISRKNISDKKPMGIGCQDSKHMGKHACANKEQCWEPCGELGKSEKHARVSNLQIGKEASKQKSTA